MDEEVKQIYNNLNRLRKLNTALSDKSFYEERGYSLENVPEYLFELSFPVKNLLPFVNKDDGYILDIGCGSGLDIYLLNKRYVGRKVFGLDISLPLLYNAKIVSKELVCANALELPFKSGTFSVVMMNGVFNLISDRKKLLIEVNRILITGGDCLVTDLYKINDITFTDESNLFNLGKAMKLDEIHEIFKNFGFKYEFGDYEKEIIPDVGIFVIRWSKI